MPSYNLSYLILIIVLDYLLVRLGLFRMFKKSGQNPLLAFVPLLSWWLWIEMIKRPKWFIIGLCLPVAGPIFRFYLTNDSLKIFNIQSTLELIMAVVIRPFYYLYLFLQPARLKYVGAENIVSFRKTKSENKGSFLREWTEILLVVALFFHGFKGFGLFQVFQINHTSSEKSVKLGDWIVVNRYVWGNRLPITPIALSFLGQQTTLFGLPTYSSFVQLPYMRMPSFSQLKRNDLIAYNIPNNVLNPEDLEIPPDKKSLNVSRCIGLPGDILEIRNGRVLINGVLQNQTSLPLQEAYVFTGKMNFQLSDEWLKKYNLTEVTANGITAEDVKKAKGQGPYVIHTTLSNAENIKKDTLLKGFEKFSNPQSIQQFIDPAYFDSTHLKWTLNNFGPIKLPKRGERVLLNYEKFKAYELAILKYEQQYLTTNGKLFFLNGQEIQYYTFKYDYYFVLGDNRGNAIDSRTFGLIPENHIEGKPWFILMGWNHIMKIENGVPGLDNNGEPIFKSSGIDWSRLFHSIK